MTEPHLNLPTRGSTATPPNRDPAWSSIDVDSSAAPPATALSGGQIVVRLVLSLVVVAASLGLLLVATGLGPVNPETALNTPAATDTTGAAPVNSDRDDGAIDTTEPTATTALVLGLTTNPTARPSSTPLPAVATPTPPPASQRVEAIIEQLGDEADAWTDGAKVSMAVVVDGLILGINPEQTQNAASEMKSVWMTAAADVAGIGALESLADDIFARSSNQAAADAISLLGVDGINAWTDQLGMNSTQLGSWRNPDASQPDLVSSEGGANESSALDQARFLVALERGDLLNADDTVLMLSWMQLAPDASSGTDPSAVFVNALPADVAAEVSHKAGWLPPGCCTRDVRVLNAMGFVPLPSGRQVPVAIMTEGGGDYEGQAAFISSAVCQLYEVLAPTSLECPVNE